MTGAWPTVGRGTEVSAILDSLHRGLGTVIVGEAGVGKTMLAREVRHQLEAAGQRCHLVVCSAHGGLPLPDFAQAGASSGLDLLAPTDRLARALGSAEGSALVVDDAHLLDDGSAEVLWRLATGGVVRAVATVRSGQRIPDRVARLLADGVCDRLDLEPLREEDVRRLLELFLGGDVEHRLTRQVVRRAGGNALLLREMVRAALQSGAIVNTHEVWRLAHDLPVGAGASELIRASLADLDPKDLAAAQLLAVGEPLRLEIAEAAVGAHVLEALEDQRVVTLDDTMNGPAVTLSHPLYGEVLRTDIAPLRLRRLRLALVEAMAAVGTSRPYDEIRSVLWRVDLGEHVDPASLLATARLARSFGGAAAEVLARAAVAADGQVPAVVLLAEILVMQDRVVEAERLLDGLVERALSADEQTASTYARALARTRLGDLAEVVAMTTEPAGDLASSAHLQAVYAQALVMDGRVDEAAALARPLAGDRSADAVTRTLAGANLAVAAMYQGRSRTGQQVVRDVMASAEAARDQLPYGLGSMMVATAIGLAQGGHLDDAEQLAQQIHDRALVTDDPWLRPRGASALGLTALTRGLPQTATRYLRIAVGSLYGFDAMFLRYNLSFLARAAALAGFVDEARSALDPPSEAPSLPLFQAEWEVAEAAVLAAEGHLIRAGSHALGAARRAASLGQWAIVGIAAGDAARYTGAPEAARLVATAAEQVDDPLLGLVAAYAKARAAGDGPELSAASMHLEEIGTILLAAEASYAAAQSHRAARDNRRAAAAAERATALHGRCEDAVIPWIAGFQAEQILTRRERHIALLAAAGRRDAEIAEDAHISIRTVQNHLAHAYRKLGVASRHDLPDALALPPSAARPRPVR